MEEEEGKTRWCPISQPQSCLGNERKREGMPPSIPRVGKPWVLGKRLWRELSCFREKKRGLSVSLLFFSTCLFVSVCLSFYLQLTLQSKTSPGTSPGQFRPKSYGSRSICWPLVTWGGCGVLCTWQVPALLTRCNWGHSVFRGQETSSSEGRAVLNPPSPGHPPGSGEGPLSTHPTLT